MPPSDLSKMHSDEILKRILESGAAPDSVFMENHRAALKAALAREAGETSVRTARYAAVTAALTVIAAVIGLVITIID